MFKEIFLKFGAMAETDQPISVACNNNYPLK
jgi:hypothetical protein